MQLETHTISVIYGYALLLSALGFKLLDHGSSPVLLLSVMSGIVMLILSNYTKFKVKTPYRVVMTITIMITALLIYQTWIYICDEEDFLLYLLTGILSVQGIWSSANLFMNR